MPVSSEQHVDLTKVEEHFEFGKNWKSYSKLITPERIEIAKSTLTQLVGVDGLKQKSFLDIGSGSGLFSVAASQLGAQRILAVDIDPFSVQTSQNTLQRFAQSGAQWNCIQKSVFDLSVQEVGRFDVVYSWGVLHHTGNMFEAIRRASQLITSEGCLVLGLYHKTDLCEFWKNEKKFYAHAPKIFQFGIRLIFKSMVLLDLLRQGINPIKHFRNYKSERGMNWSHDVHDWLGGHPYESISPTEMENFGRDLGFKIVNSFVRPAGRGVWGSGNDEYVLRKFKDV